MHGVESLVDTGKETTIPKTHGGCCAFIIDCHWPRGNRHSQAMWLMNWKYWPVLALSSTKVRYLSCAHQDLAHHNSPDGYYLFSILLWIYQMPMNIRTQFKCLPCQNDHFFLPRRNSINHCRITFWDDAIMKVTWQVQKGGFGLSNAEQAWHKLVQTKNVVTWPCRFSILVAPKQKQKARWLKMSWFRDHQPLANTQWLRMAYLPRRHGHFQRQ